MANIFTMIEAQKAKGNAYLTLEGDFISIDKIQRKAKKEYIDSLKKGIIRYSVSYEAFLSNIVDQRYVIIPAVLDAISSVGINHMTCPASTECEGK